MGTKLLLFLYIYFFKLAFCFRNYLVEWFLQTQLYVIVRFKTTHLAELDAGNFLFFLMLCYDGLVRVFIA